MDKKRIGRLIRERRDALKLSTRDAADRSGGEISSAQWNQIETGRVNWTIGMLSAALDVLNVHIETELMPGREDRPMEYARRELVDRLASIVDLLEPHEVLSLTLQVKVYEDVRGIQRDISK